MRRGQSWALSSLCPVLLLGAHWKAKAMPAPPAPAVRALLRGGGGQLSQALWAPVLVVTLVTAPRESQGAEELPASWVVSQTGSSGLDGRTPCSRAKGRGGLRPANGPGQ